MPFCIALEAQSLLKAIQIGLTHGTDFLPFVYYFFALRAKK
jgi:hypothetical protein